MADTLLVMARKARMLSANTVPIGMAQEFVRQRYRQIIDYCQWSFQFGVGQFLTNASILGTATVTRGSTSVTVSPASLPGDRTTIVGRQALFGAQNPIYDIVDNQANNTFVMAQPYGGTTGTIAYEITNVYFTSEHSDYEAMVVFVDPPNNWQLPFDIHFEELNNEDPQRSATGTPWLLADTTWNDQYLAALPDGVTDCLGYTNASSSLPRKEMWPRQQAAYNYPYIYKRRMAELTNPNDKPAGFIRSDVIQRGAYADVCMWPGTPAIPNPCYNPVTANWHESKFKQLLTDMEIIDRTTMERDLQGPLSWTRLRYPPYTWSARWLQNHIGIETGLY